MKDKYHLVKVNDYMFVLVDDEANCYNNYEQDSRVYKTIYISPSITALYNLKKAFWILEEKEND